MKYQLFDIVMLRLECGSGIFAIVALAQPPSQRPYVAVKLDRGPLVRQYELADDEILGKIGTLDPEALKLDPATVETTPSADWHLGQSFARYMAERAFTAEDRQRWALLARLQPGAAIALRRFTRRGERIECHRFQQVLPGGQKYHFTAVNANGTVYRWTLESLLLESNAP
jgi:hypothetical protein